MEGIIMRIIPIEAFSDNYIWVYSIKGKAIIVDPGESQATLDYLSDNQLDLTAILLTHKHEDHVGGVRNIQAKYPQALTYGPIEVEEFVDHIVQEGDEFKVLGKLVKVFKTAGHTEEHISFLIEDKLFCGDALFSAGCGRVFTGDYQAQFDGLHKFNQLADEVEIFAGHEYTVTNLRYALKVRPNHEELMPALEQAEQLRADETPTLPSTIGYERKINPFLQAEDLEEFIELRNGRDNF